MYNTIPDLFRKQSIENIFSTNTFQTCWQTWEAEINKLLGENMVKTKIKKSIPLSRLDDDSTEYFF